MNRTQSTKKKFVSFKIECTTLSFMGGFYLCAYQRTPERFLVIGDSNFSMWQRCQVGWRAWSSQVRFEPHHGNAFCLTALYRIFSYLVTELVVDINFVCSTGNLVQPQNVSDHKDILA